MRNKNNDEPSDEFDRIMIPAFITRSFERLAGSPGAAAPTDRATERRSPTETRAPGDPDAPVTDEDQPAPRSRWTGYRGKLLLYGVGTVVMVYLQSRR